MPETLDLKNAAENAVSSYEMIIKSVGVIFDTTHQIPDDFQEVFLDNKEEGRKINTELRDILAHNEHLRKKDFDSMTQGVLSAQEEREAEVKNLLKGYLNQQREMARALRENLAKFKDVLAKGDLQRVKEFQEMTKEVLANQDARKEEVSSKLKEFQKERQEMAKGLKKAGCVSVATSIETGNEKIRNEILNKRLTNEQIIRGAKLLYIDETSFSVLGKKWWVWVFRSDTDMLLVIRNSRGNNVLEEILGKDYAGIVICDCWRAYDFLSNAILQRCWAHLLRKSKELKSVAGRHFHKKLSALFDEIVKFNNTEKSEKQRLRKYKQMTKKLQKITQYYSMYEECEAVTKYIDFHIESWFTCIKIAGVQPTNNYAEQAIRETVLVRKIIGAFRSVEGTKTYETLASLIATWRLQKLDLKKELTRMLSANLC